MRTCLTVLLGFTLSTISTVPAQGTGPGTGTGTGTGQPPTHSIVGWGDYVFDSRWTHADGFIKVGPVNNRAAALRADGSIVCWGENGNGECMLPNAPPGTSYVDLIVHPYNGDTLALRSDGLIVDQTGQPWSGMNTSPLPPGVRFVSLAGFGVYGEIALLRSDGRVSVHIPLFERYFPKPVANVPQLPPGTQWTQIAVEDFHVVALRSDGLVGVWNDYAQTLYAPPLGRQFVSVSASGRVIAALDSGGRITVWGDNSKGHKSVPLLPAGLSYTAVSVCHYGIVATRSDGSVVAWGDSTAPVIRDVPTGPGDFQRVFAGAVHGYAVDSAGRLTSWGSDWPGMWTDAGFLGSGIQPEGIRQFDGWNTHWCGLTDSGQVSIWGDYSPSFRPIPPLPPGTSYVDLAWNERELALLRSDGAVVTPSNWPTVHPSGSVAGAGRTLVRVFTAVGQVYGLQDDGALVPVIQWSGGPLAPPPQVPPGRHVEDVAMCSTHGLLLLDDGSVVGWGSNTEGQLNIPANDGYRFTRIAVARDRSMALREDGRAVTWGRCTAEPCGAWGAGVQDYVRIALGEGHRAALRSSGQIDVWGNLPPHVAQIPDLPAGQSYLDVQATAGGVQARRGPRASYVLEQFGCPDSPGILSDRMVPQDLPQMGRPFRLLVEDTPLNLALVWTGVVDLANPSWSHPIPWTLAGNVWCGLHVPTPIDATPVIGSGGRCRATWQIPNDPGLLGMAFRQQAVVPYRYQPGTVLFRLTSAYMGIVGGN